MTRGFLGVFAYSHRALQLVWTTSRTLTIAFAILTLVAGTLPAGAKGDDVSRATVKFYVSKVATAGKLDLYPILGDWDEKTITANSAPPVRSEL